jgi:uncharacterized membrane protein
LYFNILSRFGYGDGRRGATSRNVEIQDLTPIALTAIAVVWLVLLLAAPVAAAHGRVPVVTVAAYQVGSLVCHQRPERSFHLAGVQMPVCARCFGLYAAGVAGLVLAWTRRKPLSTRATRTTLALAALPILLTVGLEWAGTIQTTNVERMLTSLPLGVTAGLVIVGLLPPSLGASATRTKGTVAL